MLNPALAIFSMVASWRLPLGRPKRNFCFSVIVKLSNGAGSNVGRTQAGPPKGGTTYQNKSGSHAAFAALDAEFVFGDEAEGAGIEFAFGELDAGVEGFGGVAFEDWDGGLGDDGAAVDALVDEVDGATGDFDA